MSRSAHFLLVALCCLGTAQADPVIEYGDLEDFVFAVPEPVSGVLDTLASDLSVDADGPKAESGGASSGGSAQKRRNARRGISNDPAAERQPQVAREDPVRDLLRSLVNVQKPDGAVDGQPLDPRRPLARPEPDIAIEIPGSEAFKRGMAELIAMAVEPEAGETGRVTFSLAGLSGFSIAQGPGRQGLVFSLDEFEVLSWHGAAGYASPSVAPLAGLPERGAPGSRPAEGGESPGSHGHEGDRPAEGTSPARLILQVGEALLDFLIHPLVVLFAVALLGARLAWIAVASRG